MSYNLITQNQLDAIADAESWENGEGSYFKQVLKICCKQNSTKVFSDDVWKHRIEKYKKLGATDDDIQWNTDYANKHSYHVCIRPDGHFGKCKFSPADFTKTKTPFRSKLNDALANPGANKYPFTNRGGAIPMAPILDKNRLQELYPTVYRGDNFYKKNNLDNVGIREQRAATGYQSATCLVDMLAMTTRLKGASEWLKFDPNENKMFNKHVEYLIKYYKDMYNVSIVNKDGFLCGPILPDSISELSIEQFGKGQEDDEDENQLSIQFTHVHPVTNNKFMTRGFNLWFATKKENNMMGIMSYPEFKLAVKEASLDR